MDAEKVVTVVVRQEEGVDAGRVDPEPVHVRQERRSRVEQQPAIDHDRAVVTLAGEGGAAAEEGELHFKKGKRGGGDRIPGVTVG